jgi:hypothetical protein
MTPERLARLAVPFVLGFVLCAFVSQVLQSLHLL